MKLTDRDNMLYTGKLLQQITETFSAYNNQIEALEVEYVLPSGLRVTIDTTPTNIITITQV